MHDVPQGHPHELIVLASRRHEPGDWARAHDWTTASLGRPWRAVALFSPPKPAEPMPTPGQFTWPVHGLEVLVFADLDADLLADLARELLEQGATVVRAMPRARSERWFRRWPE